MTRCLRRCGCSTFNVCQPKAWVLSYRYGLVDRATFYKGDLDENCVFAGFHANDGKTRLAAVGNADIGRADPAGSALFSHAQNPLTAAATGTTTGCHPAGKRFWSAASPTDATFPRGIVTATGHFCIWENRKRDVDGENRRAVAPVSQHAGAVAA